MPKFVLSLLFVIVILAACNQQPTPADLDPKPNPSDVFAKVRVDLDRTRNSVEMESFTSEQGKLKAQQATPPGEARELVREEDFEETLVDFQFLPDRDVLTFTFTNITSLYFTQPAFVMIEVIADCDSFADPPPIADSFEIDLTDASLGGDGALEPNETSAEVEVALLHGEDGPPRCFFMTWNAAVTDQLTSPETSEQVAVPYTIDSEIQGGFELLTTYARKPAEASGTVDMYLLDTIFNSVFLLDADGEVVAFDVAAKDVKETVTFSYDNSAKADVYLSLTLTGLTFEQLLSSYARIEAHPRFAELVALHRAARRIPLSDEAANLSRAIAVDIYNDFQSDTSQLSTQTVIDDFGGDQSVAFDLFPQDPDDPRKVNLSVSETSIDQRLFVFEGDVPNLSLDFLNNANSVPTKGSSYIGQSPNFYGFRNHGAPRQFSFALDVPEDDCKVYTLVTSAFARGKDNSALSHNNNPNYANYANAVGNLLTVYGAVTGNVAKKGTVKQLVDAAYPFWVISETGVSNSQKFANAVQQGNAAAATEAMFDTLYDGARAIAETAQGESLPEIIVDILDNKPSSPRVHKILKTRVRVAITVPAAAGFSVFTASAAQEYDDDIKSARFSTGDPVIELTSSTNEMKLALEESASGTITVRNTGCRDLEYDRAGHVYINNRFYSFDFQDISGIILPEAQKELPFNVTCFDKEDSGLSQVSASGRGNAVANDIEVFSNTLDIDVACGLSRIEIDAQHLFGVRGGGKVVSYVTGDIAGSPNREHFSNNPIEVYIVEPGTQEVRLGAEDGGGLLVLGLKKTFDLEPGEVAQWSPSASLSVEMKDVYDGPVDDCERVQGVYSVNINGLFDTYPDIPIDGSVMYIDGGSIDTIERTKLENKPLMVDARTIRSCNLPEREHAIGWDIEYNFINDAPEGFYAFIEGPMDNVDNRWPTYTWNRTDLTTDEEFCPIVPIDVLTTSIDGRPDAPQRLRNLPAGDYGGELMRFETLYKHDYRSSVNGDPLFTSSFSPPFLDKKKTYNGVKQWVHLVGAWSGSCSSGSLQSLGIQSHGAPEVKGEMLFEPFEKPKLTQRRLRGF